MNGISLLAILAAVAIAVGVALKNSPKGDRKS